MPKRSSKKKSRDINTLASQIVSETTGEDIPKVKPSTLETLEDKPTKNPNAVALGRLGGKKGGKVRAEKLTPEKRSEIAKKAAEV